MSPIPTKHTYRGVKAASCQVFDHDKKCTLTASDGHFIFDWREVPVSPVIVNGPQSCEMLANVTKCKFGNQGAICKFVPSYISDARYALQCNGL